MRQKRDARRMQRPAVSSLGAASPSAPVSE